MHILAGLLVGGFVLWLWLGGHWFGRVLAFLVFTPLFILFFAIWTSDPTFPAERALMLWALAAVLAWFISGLPGRRVQR